ncbi:MAG: 6-pyruvoyl trahydropterin synthase family protein [Planctomycetota bacterium]|jgi:6-pyruvoyltetrahydropterin/6-carboxytetrahydropterin synthase
MYELAVERDFEAAHAVTMDGRREAAHDHTWHVSVVVSGPTVGSEGLLCDFHVVERQLDRALEPLRGCDLNQTPPFDHVNPTAEMVARHLAEAIGPGLPEGVVLAGVSVTEAPGCTATFRPD